MTPGYLVADDAKRTMDTFLQAVIQGVGLGALDGLLALGIVLVYRTSGVLNFAQAATGALGTFVIYSVSQGRSLWIAVPAGLLASALLGIGTFRAVSTIDAPRQALTWAVATLAVAILIYQGIRIGWGTTILGPFPNPIGLQRSWIVGSVSVAAQTLWAVGIATSAAIAIGAYLRFTRIGTMLRAVADNPDAASLCGGNIGLLVAGVWAVAGALSCAAGFFAALTLFDPTVLDVYFIGALIAAVLGGLRSLTGAFLGAIALEISRNLFQTYAGDWAAYTQTFLILMLIGVLILAPRRWLAQGPVRSV